MVLLFVTAAVIALILNPLVAGLQRFHLPRGVAIVCVYLGFVAALVAAGVLLANPISDQVTTLRDDIPSITDSANQRLADVQDYFDRKGINVEIKKQGQTALDTLQSKVVGGTDSIVSFGTDLLTKLVTASFGLILVFVLSVYMLIHGERIGALVRGVMPPGDGTREDDYPARVVRAVAGYVRGQLLFSVVMGAGAGIGLWIFGVIGIFPDGKTYALAFGVWFGLMELVPYVGPVPGRRAAAARGALPGPDHRGVGGAALRRAAADRGPRRLAADLRPRAAHQPAARHLRPAVRGRAVRHHRGAGGAAGGRRRARDGRLPAPAPGARAVGDA